MIKNITFFILLCCCTICSWSQNEKERFDEFEKLFKEVKKISNDSCLSLAREYINSFSNDTLNLKIEKYKADALYATGKRKIADSIYKMVLPVYKKERDYATIFKIFNRQGLFYFQTGRLLRGLKYSIEVQDFIDRNNEYLQTRDYQIEIAALYRIIGIIYAIQAESDDTFNQETSEKYFKKAYTTIVPLKEPETEGLLLFNIGNIMQSKDSTIFYWNRALDVFEKNNLSHKKGPVYQNLAILYIDSKEYQKALEYLNLAAPYIDIKKSPFDFSLFHIKYGAAYLGLNQNQKSINKTNEGLKIAIQYEMSSLEREAYELLIQAYQKSNQFELALKTYIKYDTLTKRANNIETERIFRDTEAKYKTKEQQAQIEILKQTELLKNSQIRQQRLFLWLIAIVMLSIIVLTYLVWKRAQQRKKMNAQLIKLDKDRTRFLVNISHELKTPVSLIHGPLQDTFEQLEKSNFKRVQRNLHKIANNTQKLLQLTEEVLDISKLDEGFLKVHLHPINLKDFVTRVYYAFESLAIRNKIEWKSEIAIPDKVYEIDDNKLEKILNNLFSNAIKHTPKNGKVSFVTRVESNKLVCCIKDTGNGISEESITKIFDRYFQDDSQEKPSSGIGIGLSLVKELIEVLDGSIEVKSKVNEGTEFIVAIPVKESDKKAISTSTQVSILDTENRPDIDLSNSNRPHVLVIEDNIEMADFIQQLLSDDYRVSLASNGVEGNARLQSEKFDLITVDVMMPKMDGIEFVTNLKEHPEWKSISTVMITALSEESDRIKGLRLGVDDYITKPFSGNELKARVHNLIQNSFVRKETKSDTTTEEIIGTEKEFLQKTKQIVELNLDNNSFSVKDLSEALNLSERQTNRVLKKITGLSCLQFIREVRLQKAYQFLQSRKYATIAEVSYTVGFENASYFTKIFTIRFGKKPSEML